MSPKLKTIYSQIGAKGLEKIAQDFSVSTDIAFVKKEVNKEDKILDLACGYGRITIPLAKAGMDIIGIDLDKGLIESAKKRSSKENLNIQFDIGNMTKLPYKNNSFDKILCLWNSFSDLLTQKEQLEALAEMKRVLKVKGSAILILPNGDSKQWKSRVKDSKEGRIVTSILEGMIEKQYIHDKNSFDKLLRNSSFKKYQIKHINMHKKRRMLVRLTN